MSLWSGKPASGHSRPCAEEVSNLLLHGRPPVPTTTTWPCISIQETVREKATCPQGKVHPLIQLCVFMALFLLCSTPTRANTINAASCSLTDVQNAINSANNGATLVVPSGSCSWSGGTATIPSTKGITLSGTAVTITGGSHITINANATTSTRVTGFTLTGAWPCCGNSAIAAYGSPGQATYRIDHNTIIGDVATNSQTLIQIQNNGPGLIDHNTLTAPNNAEIVHNFGLGSNGNNGWVDDVTPGGPQMVFIEDNTFTNTGTSFLCSAVQSY